MTSLNHIYRLRWIGHLLFWIISAVFMMLQLYFASGKNLDINTGTILKALLPVIGFASSVYLNLYILIPRFLKPKKYIFYTFWLLATCAGSSIVIVLFFMFPFHFLFSEGSRYDHFDSTVFSSYFFANLIYAGLTSFLKFIKDWIELQDINLRLATAEKQKLQAELKILKGQINPHFLFNSLNNIYSLSLTNSEKVPDMILKLSELMRYVLYESGKDFVDLAREIDFIDNFIELHRIRTSEKVQITYSSEGNVPDKKIMPFIFEPFIDNAFKHGLKSKKGIPFIKIDLRFLKSEELIFTVENSYDENKKWDKKAHGIGIENARQRLSHLYQPAEYDLEINEFDNVFSVNLRLKLK